MTAAIDAPQGGASGAWPSTGGAATSGPRRFIPLDALRGVAIALVIVHHVWFQFPAARHSVVAELIAAVGWAGVDLFFGISGFLITTILLRYPQGESLVPFYIRRFFRIIPIYMVAVVLYLLAAIAVGHDDGVLHRIWVNFLLLTAWTIPFWGENGVPYTITWSVSVEEFAYLLFGFLFIASRPDFAMLLRWVVVGALVVRVVCIALFAFEPITLYYFAPGRVDAIAMGGVMATLRRDTIRRLTVPVWIPWIVWFAVVAACALVRRETVLVATVGYTAIACASAWLVLCVVGRPEDRLWPVTRWFASLGLVSYFVYLFHGFVIAALVRLLPPQVGAAAGVLGLSVVVAIITFLAARLSWKFFEYPLIRRGRCMSDSYGSAGSQG